MPAAKSSGKSSSKGKGSAKASAEKGSAKTSDKSSEKTPNSAKGSSSSDAESVKVAVRVRPFNQREKDRRATLIIQMKGNTTSIRNPDAMKDASKSFTFDYSYWSHDGYQEEPNGLLVPTTSKYADQRKVFNDLGQGVLDNAWKGYNCSLFAYGQTGSGKSYSIVGFGVNKGIVPVTCEELFAKIEQGDKSKQKFQVSFSMLEIYNEQVRDLLSKETPKGGLQVRQSPKEGSFYVQGLKKVPVQNYREIEKRIEQGTANRTLASTNMNATSSRAHTVVTIVFDQITKKESGETKKSSVMNLVDLAGSERADASGATGDRLKEGANINKSLSALGNVISALADLSTGKKKILVPYRDSILTKLLQHALGGNSKTIMIAALSPADINYDETLSTLRYADRAKKIKTKAIVNENPVDKMIRELKEENDRLQKQLLQSSEIQVVQKGLSPEELEREREKIRQELMMQMQENAEQMMNWEERVAQTKTEDVELNKEEDAKSKIKKGPHLINLNEDPQLSGVILHGIGKKKTTIGHMKAKPAPDIPLSGLSIQKRHAVITNDKKEVVIEACDGDGQVRPKTKVNGQPLIGPMVLEHLDRILFGENHLYVFHNPLNPKSSNKDLPKHISWEFAQKELAEAKGFGKKHNEVLTKEQQIVQDQVIDILPMVSEANAISEELNKYCQFEAVLAPIVSQEFGLGERTSKVMIKMKNLLTGNCWLWERGKFMNRRYLMQDMYQKFLDLDLEENLPREEDPFWEPPEPYLIGTANAYLQALGYCLDFDESIAVQDYKGNEEGYVACSVSPCSQSGKPLDEDSFVEDPAELKGKAYHFKVTVKSAAVNDQRYSQGLKVKYKVYKDDEFTETKMMKGTLEPEFNHSKVFSFNCIADEHLKFFDHGCITFMLFANQDDVKADPRFAKMSTKELRQMKAIEKPREQNRRGTIFALSGGGAGDETAELRTELVIAQNMNKRLMHKERRMQELCQEWDSKKDSEKNFADFYRAVRAVSFSTGTKLKTRVQVVNQLQEDDTISVHLFGEGEEELKREAARHGDVIPLDSLKKQYPVTIGNLDDPSTVALLHGRRYSMVNQRFQGQAEYMKGKNGDKETSKACLIQ